MMALYANCHRDPAKHEPFTIEDFTGQPRITHNGHVDMAGFKREIIGLAQTGTLSAHEIPPEDPRAKANAEAVAKYLEAMNG